jgi:predicted molibdopterin-dependent oxidoreductase YjgC
VITLTIDGIKATVAPGTTVLEAARGLNISVPTLCHHPKLTPYGGCRLCIVEVKGVPRPLTSCTTPATEGMEVTTNTPALESLRKTVLELILSDHPNECMVCEAAGDCTLQEMAYTYGVKENRLGGERRQYEKRDANPFIERDMEKCILCARCVKVCKEVQGVSAIDLAYRGFQAKVCPSFEHDLDCEFCGQCVAVCPTGALTGKTWARKGRQKDVREVDTVCGYCGVGCNITLHVKDNEVVRVGSKPDTCNEGWLCVKGRFGYKFINSPDRLRAPLIRKDGVFVEASWDEALQYVADNLKAIKDKYGPDSIGGLSSARCTNEDTNLFQKFVRGAIGTNNVDHCARL